jgi:cation:H+ antiporter
MIFVNFLVLIIGFAALVKGADFFVDGSASLAKKFHVPSLIIGLTIVAFGTSAPELAVSTTAALNHSNEIALSNVIGSNIFNLLVVLGFCALFSPVPVSSEILKRDFPLSILITVLVLIFGGGLIEGRAAGSTVGTISRFEGLALLIVFAVFMFLLVRNAMHSQTEEEAAQENISLKKCILLMIVGIALIVIGGQAVVDSAKSIAYFFGMSETLVGLTIVAVGTSLPELVTSIVASCKHENGLAVGNVVGSNMFNIMFILGTTAVLNPLPVTYELSVNLLFLLLISAVTFVFITTGKQLSRAEGAVMCMLYVGQTAFAIMG